MLGTSLFSNAAIQTGPLSNVLYDIADCIQ